MEQPKPTLESLPQMWRRRAATLREWGVAAGAARLLERCAVELEQALATAGSEVLTVPAAARLTGLSAGHLRGLVATGKLPNVGVRYRPRVRRSDLSAIARPNGTGPAPRPQRRKSSTITDIADKLR